jgi:prephenate dehydrogenase
VTRAAVVGLGLIGGSAALALEARGYDRDAGARARARERGIDVVDSLVEAVRGRNVVLLAVPTGETPALLNEAAAAAPQALVTDTASLKLPIAAAAALLPAAARFVGGHPMAGSRTPGLAGARADLFRDRPWLIVPTERSDFHSIAAVQDLVRAMGARPLVVDAQRHDALLTWISHLPHAVASALARAVSSGAGAGLDRMAGPGLLDTTRGADTPAPLALELSLADPEALHAAIEAVRGELGELSRRLRGRNREELRSYFEEAARLRRNLDPSPSPPRRGKG